MRKVSGHLRMLWRKEMQKYDFAGTEGSVCLLSVGEWKEIKGDYPHKRAFYRSINPVQYCKVEMFGECFFGTVKMPRDTKGKTAPPAFGFYQKEEELFFVEEGSLLKKILGKMEEDPPGARSLNQLLLVIFEALIEEDVIYLQQQEEKLSGLEEELLHRMPEQFYETMIQYRKQFSHYHSYYEQLMDIACSVQSAYGLQLAPEEKAHWQLYANHAERLYNHVERLREDVVQIRELYQSLIAVQQNKVMSFLTVVTTIFLPLTLIAGWYGMNFPNMPEFRWEYAYLAVTAISVCIILLEIVYFKKKKML